MNMEKTSKSKNKQTRQLVLWIAALAVVTTLASLGGQSDMGKIFRHAVTYTLLTTIAAAAVGLALYNIVQPGNLLAAVGIALAKMPQGERKDIVTKGLLGLQDLLFLLIHGLIWALPLGIVAFAAQLSAQFTAGIVMESLGKYVAVIPHNSYNSDAKVLKNY